MKKRLFYTIFLSKGIILFNTILHEIKESIQRRKMSDMMNRSNRYHNNYYNENGNNSRDVNVDDKEEEDYEIEIEDL